MGKEISGRGILGFLGRMWSTAWRYTVAGLLVWIPLIITSWVCWILVDRFVFGIDRLFESLFGNLQTMAKRSVWLSVYAEVGYRRGIGFVLVLILFFFTGLFARQLVGRKIIGYGERIVQQIPLISRVYRAVQQIRDTFVGRQGSVFQKVCVIEYPRPGLLSLAFIMSRERGIVQDAMGQDLYAVFLPTTPNPTSGYLLYVPPRDVTLIDISVEEAMKLIVSGGAYDPGKRIVGDAEPLLEDDVVKDLAPLP